MVEHNSDVYNPPYRDLLPYTCIMKKRYVGGIVYITVMFDHPSLVSLLFAVLVSLHPVTFSNVFYYLFMSFFLAAAHAICHHRAEVGVLTSSRSPCFGIWTILTLVFTLPALAEESDPSQPFSGWILALRQ